MCGGRCYHLGPSPLTYAAAEAYCESVGAHLATPRSLPENDCVWKLVENEVGSSGGWLGYSGGTSDTSPHQGADGQGAPDSYTNWADSQPGYENECVMLIYYAGGYKWIDRTNCQDFWPTVCQLPACSRAGCSDEF